MKRLFKFNAEKQNSHDGLTNGKRAGNAEEGVLASLAARGETGQIVHGEDGIRDLLADLGHLCDREGLDFTNITATAKKDWRAER